MSGKGRPQRQNLGGKFVRITHKRCPDCEYEGRLTNDGRSRIVSGSQLRGSSRYVGLSKASVGCATCEGKGYIPIGPNDPESIDPYARKK